MISWRACGSALFFLISLSVLLGSFFPHREQIATENQLLLEAFRSGNYPEAVTLAERAVAQTSANHPQHIRALIELGHVLMASDRFDEAREHMKRAADIATTTQSANSPLLADALDGLGASYMLKGYPFMFHPPTEAAEPIMRRALTIRENLIWADEMAYVDLVERLVTLVQRAGGNQGSDESERILARAIALTREELGEEHVAVGLLLLNYARVVQTRAFINNRRTSARDAEDGAPGFAEQLEASREALVNPFAPLAPDMNALGQETFFNGNEKYSKLGKEIIAKAFARGDINDATLLLTSSLVTELSSIAGEYRYRTGTNRTERVAKAERIYAFIRDLRPRGVNASYAMHLRDVWRQGATQLMELYESEKRTQDVEAIAAQLSAYYAKKKAAGPIPFVTGESMNIRLGRYYENIGALLMAEKYWKKEIAELQAGSDLKELADGLDGGLMTFHPNTLDGLAGFYERQGRHADAEAMLEQSIEIRTRLKGASHRDVKEVNRRLALYRGRLNGAPPPEPANAAPYVPGLMESGPSCPVNDPDIVAQLDGRLPGDADAGKLFEDCSLDDVAALLRKAEGQHVEEKRAEGKASGKMQPELDEMTASYDLQRARTAFENRNWKSAYELFRSVEPWEFANQQAGTANKLMSWDDTDNRPVSLSLILIKAAWQLFEIDPKRSSELLEATFEAAQRSQLLSAASALSQVDARHASGSPRLASVLREREALIAQHKRLDAQLKDSVLNPSVGAKSVVANSEQITELSKQIAALDETLSRDFPDHIAFSRPQPISVAQVQHQLKADEALVLLTTTPRLGDAEMPGIPTETLDAMRMRPNVFPRETFVWAVTKTDARWVKADLGGLNVPQEIFALRCGLDTAYWTPGSKLRQRCEAALRVPKPVNGYPPFHIYKAFTLYRALFGKVEDLIADKHLLIAPSGAFTVLPLQVLVTKEPGPKTPTKAAPTQLAAYEDVSWLGARNPITVLPSVASFKTLRERRARSRPARPFLGFGNPVLGRASPPVPHPEPAALMPSGATCGNLGPADVKRHLPESGPSRQALLRAGLADVEKLREQAPLPETAYELCSIARKLGASDDDVVLGPRMTEAGIKAMSAKGALRRYAILHFATHGFLASDSVSFAGSGAEPALLFTPPTTATQEDDGLLTASEITQLELDAEWVIMSACRTAAGEAQDADTLSGLARAFFYAGAQTLLVSHWAVESDAAVILTTSAFEALAADPAIGKAEALRRAMVTLQSKGGTNLHPVAWAPFSLVGGGKD